MHGPHNREFHALWNQLRDEHEELVIKGYTGEGFLSEGKRLGGQRIPLDEARRRARAAAEQRRILSKNSGRRLGGSSVLQGTDMRKLRADAAQRRVEVTMGCASGTDKSAELAEEASRNGFRTKAEEEDANEQAILQAFIELIQEEEREKYGASYVPPSQENPAGPRTQASPPPDSHNSNSPFSVEVSSTVHSEGIDVTSDNSSYDTPWTCPTCTLLNQSTFLCCDACAAERPAPSNTNTATGYASRDDVRTKPRNSTKRTWEDEDATPRNTFVFKNRTCAVDSLASLDQGANKRPLGWLCDKCGTFMETQWWTCSCCGKMKLAS